MDNNTDTRHIPLIAATSANRLGILVLGFVVMVIVTGLVQGMLQALLADKRDIFLISATVQCILAFILPSWLAARLCSTDTAGYLGLGRDAALRQFAGTLLLLLVMTPAMNAVIDWNAHLSLPASMSALEASMRTLEDAAAATTSMILSDSSVWGLVSGVLVVGCLTGFAEEMFFRGGLQRALTATRVNPHVAVWTAAFIFSFVHFQFFGFVPRLLLGACFGYLYWYTRSLWVSAFAHALNNSMVVVGAWLSARGVADVDIDGIGAGSVWAPIVSVAAVVVLLALFGRTLFRPVR